MNAASQNPILRPSQFDRVQLLALCGLMFLGAAFVYSATMASDPSSAEAWYRGKWFQQVIWYGLGGAAALAVCLIDYRSIARWALVIYWGMIFLLVIVLLVGSTHGWGARRWLDLGPFQCQPSEFAKLAVIFVLADFLSRPVEELRRPMSFFKALGMVFLPFALILVEPDLGSALVLVPTGLAMMFVAGVPKKFLLRFLTAGALLAGLLLVDILFTPLGRWHLKLESYQRERLLVYFGADFAPSGASAQDKAEAKRRRWEKSYQVRQALISVGSGGWFGKGWRKGDQTALGFLPPGAAHNDFIFSVIAEEEGFAGSIVVLTLYGVLLFTGIRIAGQARDRLGKVLAVGVVALLFSHVFINIGMNIRLVPVTGIPLPLLSYGGSSVLGSFIALGILQNVYRYRKAY